MDLDFDRDDLVKFPCIVAVNKDKHRKKEEPGCTITIPDFHVTIDGEDYLTALALASETITALYEYYVSRNLSVPQEITWEEVDKACRHDSRFPSYVTILP